MEAIKEWIESNRHGYSYGDGYGSGSGYGDGSGSGSGSGYGYGSGSGSGSGSGYGSGLKAFNGMDVYIIDGIQTIITGVKLSLAKGFILETDLTLTPCYIVKGDGYFAHGKTVKEANEALRSKIYENMDTDDAIEKFLETYKRGEKYPGKEFFEWHHYLTGSCLMGRESFVHSNGIDLNETYTVEEFIAICENAYGSETIKQLKERYNNG